jgi:hypothetical protein
VGAELSSWSDLGERWPSRLVATAAEDHLSFHTLRFAALSDCRTIVINEDRTPTHGYSATREAAMAAFAKSWRRK